MRLRALLFAVLVANLAATGAMLTLAAAFFLMLGEGAGGVACLGMRG